MKIAGVVLLVVGLVLSAAGLFGQLVLTEDEGHHDGREYGLASSATEGADELMVADAGDTGSTDVWIERAGQVLVDYDEIHDARFHTYSVADDLSDYAHVAAAEIGPDGRAPARTLPGDHRIVTQSSPAAGPDLLEFGIDATGPASAAPSGTVVADGDVWDDGSGLVVTRQGLDFVVSEPWTGEDHMGAPAFLALFQADTLAFVHGHAELVDDDRFSFGVEFPGRGEYLAALEFVQDGRLVTALFLLEV